MEIIKPKRLFIIIFLYTFFCTCESKTIHDTPNINVKHFFSSKSTKYVIKYEHLFVDTLFIPKDCELVFNGGKLGGPIVFNNTKLRGTVNLKGSSLAGTISNKTFNAAWICSMDGVTDDAPIINNIIESCGNVFFPKGTYKLISSSGSNHNADFHISICKSNVSIIGEKGTVFDTSERKGILCVYSKPGNIDDNINNININNIIFQTHNDGNYFHQWTHSLQMIGVNGICIQNCIFNDFWGDAICLCHYGDTPQTGERTRNQNVKIINNTIIGGDHHNNRNGISVINGKNVLIKGNVIKNTSRKDMPGGIDIEPNNAAYTIDNIRIIGNTLECIRGSCGAIEVCMFNGGPGHNIYIENNTIRNCNKGLYIYLKTDNTTDNFVIRDNYIDENTPPYDFVGNGSSKNWIITDNTFEHPCLQDIPGKIKVENLIIKNNKKKGLFIWIINSYSDKLILVSLLIAILLVSFYYVRKKKYKNENIVSI